MSRTDGPAVELLRLDRRFAVCVKPPGVLSTDEPGGMPELLREALGDPQGCIRGVHRLDRVTGGVMVYARSRAAAAILGEQLRSGRFQKEYLAAVRGGPAAEAGILRDLLLRDRAARITRVAAEPQPGAQQAELEYRVLERAGGLCLLHIRLHTGRTHQIRAQLASRGLPLLGDVKYGGEREEYGPALWAFRLAFDHPETGERVEVSAPPPDLAPWRFFAVWRGVDKAEE